MKSQSKKPSITKGKAAAKGITKKPPPAGAAANKALPSRGAVKPGKTGKASKHDTILTLLHKPEGATIVALMKATGWQAHSVRGFFSGVIRKKLGLQLASEKIKDQRRYRIVQAP